MTVPMALPPTHPPPHPVSLKSCLSRQLTAGASFEGVVEARNMIGVISDGSWKGEAAIQGRGDEFGQRLPAGLVECQYLCASCAWAVFQGAWLDRLRQIKMFALWCGWKYKHDRAEGGVNKKNGKYLSWKSGVFGEEVALKIGVVLRRRQLDR